MPIIQMTTYKISTPGPTPWQPGADTVVYYEFDNDLTDSSGNGKDLTLNGGTMIYGTASGGGKYGYFDSNTYTTLISLATIAYKTDTYTCSFYWQPKSIYSGTARAVFDTTMATGGDPWYFRATDSIQVRPSSQYSTQVDTWYYITIIRSPTDIKLYVNADLKNTTTYSSGSTSGSNVYLRFNAIGNNTGLRNNNYIGQFIIESKGWTLSEIQDYYNSTCADYGLSPIS